MTGIPTQFAIADLVLEARRASGAPVPADADLPFFYLGAVGPAFGDFLPAKVELGGAEPNSRVYAAWQPILGLLAGTPGVPGLHANLGTLRDRLNGFRDAVSRKDKFALLAMKSELTELPDVLDRLQAQLLSVQGIRDAVAQAVYNVGSGRAGASPSTRWKVPPARGWHSRNTLHGSRTGRFLRELRQRADASGDSKLIAYADGATIAYAGALSGNAFLNGVAGGPHRNHWWRHRWVSNHVDAWVWGYVAKRRAVRAAGAEIVFTNGGRVPVPPLPNWDNACGAELQRRIAIGGISETEVLAAIQAGTPVPARLPANLVSLWLDSYRATYGVPAAGETPGGVDEGGVQSAFALTWLTLWIQTSAGFLTCTPPDRVNYPDGCGERPDWVAVDGSVLVGGQVIQPPTPERPEPSVAEIASAIIAAILGIVQFAVGNIAGGVELILAGVALLDDATEPDWDAFHCHGEWGAAFVVNLENAVRDMLVAAGFAPPYTVQLQHNEIQFQTWGGDIVPPSAALATCRSPSALQNGYPRSVWLPTPTNTSNWTRYPTEPAESPNQVSYRPGDNWWPSDFVDGLSWVDMGAGATPRFVVTQNNPIATRAGAPTVLSHDERTDRVHVIANDGVVETGFGNAVDLAQALLAADPALLQDWDLDGDRGIGWPTWVWRDGTVPPGEVEPE